MKTFFCFWDNDDLHCVKDISTWERKMFLNSIHDQYTESCPVNLRQMILKAEILRNKKPEIWICKLQDYDEDQLCDLFYSSFEMFVKKVSKNGNKVYG